MNLQFCKRLVLFVVIFCLAVASSNVIAGKPDKPPKPRPNPDLVDGSACVDSGSFFPAFVYSIESEKGSEIILSNAAGDCTIPVYKTSAGIGGTPSYLSYRLFEDKGRIVFTEAQPITSRPFRDTPPKIQLLEFQFDGAEIVSELPLSPTLLIEGPDIDGMRQGNFRASDLSPSGEHVLFAGYTVDSETGTKTNYFIYEIEIECSPVTNCTNRVFETQLMDGYLPVVQSPRYSLTRDRIYFEYGSSVRKLAFIEKDLNGEWPSLDYVTSSDPQLSSDPTLILEHGDGRYQFALGYWDHDGDTLINEVIAHPRRFPELDAYTIEILDVEHCLSTEQPGADECVVIGDRSDDALVIYGSGPSFITIPDDNPKLLFMDKVNGSFGPAIFEFELDTAAESILIDALESRKHEQVIQGVDSAN